MVRYVCQRECGQYGCTNRDAKSGHNEKDDFWRQGLSPLGGTHNTHSNHAGARTVNKKVLIGRRCWIADRLPVILLNAAFIGFHDEALGFTSFWVVGESSQTFAIVRDRALIVQSYLSRVYFGRSAAAPHAKNANSRGGKPHCTKNWHDPTPTAFACRYKNKLCLCLRAYHR